LPFTVDARFSAEAPECVEVDLSPPGRDPRHIADDHSPGGRIASQSNVASSHRPLPRPAMVVGDDFGYFTRLSIRPGSGDGTVWLTGGPWYGRDDRGHSTYSSEEPPPTAVWRVFQGHHEVVRS
jgi:hypothetical protein